MRGLFNLTEVGTIPKVVLEYFFNVFTQVKVVCFKDSLNVYSNYTLSHLNKDL